MSGSRSNRRRRTGSTSRRYKPSELVQVQPRRPGAFGTTEIAAAAGVVMVAIVVIVLIWVVTLRTTRDHDAEARERAERTVAAHAATLSEEIRHELLVVDQSLSILQALYIKDPANFEMMEWKKQVPALTSVADDIFIADEKRIIRQNVLPQAIGQGIGGAYVNFPHGPIELFANDGGKRQDGRIIVGETGTVEARRYLMYVVRRLEKPTNWLIGASFRTEELTKLYAQAQLGINGVTALLDSERGVLQAIAGPSARRPVVNLLKSEMLAAFKTRTTTGVWTGPTAMDNVRRIHGFSKVRDRDMYVLVGTTEVEAMAAADSLSSGAWWQAFTASTLVTAVGGLILWEVFHLRANRRRRRGQARGQADLEAAQAELAGLRTRAAVTGSQLATLLRNATDGIALLDSELRLSAWNQIFVENCGVSADVLREGLPIDEFLRHQGYDGLFGPGQSMEPEALEAEIARRVAILRTEPAGALLRQIGPDGGEIGMLVNVVQDGAGLELVLAGNHM